MIGGDRGQPFKNFQTVTIMLMRALKETHVQHVMREHRLSFFPISVDEFKERLPVDTPIQRPGTSKG